MRCRGATGCGDDAGHDAGDEEGDPESPGLTPEPLGVGEAGGVAPDTATSPRPTPEPLSAEEAGEPGVAGPSGAEAGPCEPGVAGPGETSCEAGSGDSLKVRYVD